MLDVSRPQEIESLTAGKLRTFAVVDDGFQMEWVKVSLRPVFANELVCAIASVQPGCVGAPID